MATVGIRELSRNTGSVIDAVLKSGEPTVVTKNGEPAVAVLPLEALEDLVLTTPEYIESMRQADRALLAGETVSLQSVLDELEKEGQG